MWYTPRQGRKRRTEHTPGRTVPVFHKRFSGSAGIEPHEFIRGSSQLEVGIAHPDAEGLRLVGAGHRAAVVVRQHDDRPSVELRAEDPLAGCEEVVAVG